MIGRALGVASNRGRGMPKMTWRARLQGDMKIWPYGAEARDGNGPREVTMSHHGENV